MSDFPTMVYRTPGPHAAPKGTYGYMGVADHAEYDAALADGWFASIAEAMGGKAAAEKPVEVQEVVAPIEVVIAKEVPAEEPDRAALEAKAKELGVSFNWKTSDEVLAARIAEAV
jgi:hypothetical protein